MELDEHLSNVVAGRSRDCPASLACHGIHKPHRLGLASERDPTLVEVRAGVEEKIVRAEVVGAPEESQDALIDESFTTSAGMP